MCDELFDLSEVRTQEFAPVVRAVLRSSLPWTEESVAHALASALPGLCDPEETCPHGFEPVPEWKHVARVVIELERSALADTPTPEPTAPRPRSIPCPLPA